MILLALNRYRNVAQRLYVQPGEVLKELHPDAAATIEAVFDYFRVS